MNSAHPYSHSERADQHLRSLQLLEAFAADLAGIHDVDKLLWAIAENTISKLGWVDCVIYLLSNNGESLMQKAAYGPKNVDYRAIFQPIEIPLGAGIVGQVARTGRTIRVDDTRNIEAYIMDDELRLSELAVPIQIGGRVLGVIDSEHPSPGFYTESDQLVLETIASITATKIESAISKKENDELALFYKRNPNPVLQLESSGVIAFINESASSCFAGIGSGERLDRPKLKEALETARSTGHALWECEIFEGQFDNKHTGEFRVVYLETGQFNLYGNDITHILELQRAAKSAADAKSRFLSVISHEIRTPLNAILGLTDLLIHEAPDRDEQLRHLTYMEFSGNHLLSLVNDILDLEKLASGKATKVESDFNLTELVHSIIDSFRNRAEKAGLTVKLSLAHDLPQRIRSDVKWITQILNNLIGNAIKYTEYGFVELKVEHQFETKRLVLTVTDTGKGIPKEEQERILHPFEQVRSDSNIEGTGLGLAIVSSLIKKLDGQLVINSIPAKGSRFAVTIPYASSHSVAAESTSSEGAKNDLDLGAGLNGKAPGLPSGELGSILLADDNELNRFVASKLLQRWGYSVVEAVDGKEAFEKWSSTDPDLILMDVQMPNVDGVEATLQIRKAESELPGDQKRHRDRIPIIALTADAEEKTLQRITAAGMDDRIIKPFDPTALQSILKGFLDTTQG